MKTVTSVSGGKTSAYSAANYPTDYNVFALVRTSDHLCRFPDRKLAGVVEDRIQADFVGTLEDDAIIHTIFDLEQHIGRKIDWVTGIEFDRVIWERGGWLPNKLHRYCTAALKIEPIFHWWRKNFKSPVEMNIGFRGNEGHRAKKILKKINKNGFLEYKAIVGTAGTRNKWGQVEWQKPNFPLLSDNVHKWQIENYWEFQCVQFAKLNNCVGCFHRNPVLLKKMSVVHPAKMRWFAQKEIEKNSRWRSDVSYADIMNSNLQLELEYSDFSECDAGYCEP